MNICYSRCIYCGRQTPHEVCHAHSETLNPGWMERLPPDFELDALWQQGFNQEPESCDDPTCALRLAEAS